MADETQIIELHGNGGDPIRVTVAEDAGIAKGAILSVANPRTAAVAGANESFIGIAASEKVAGDGSTTLAVYTKGIFNMRADAAGHAAGVRLTTGAANRTKTAVAGDLLKGCVGIALSTMGANVWGPVLVGSGL